ncbi:MAG: glycosyltransferase family 2 protein [Acidimicrobiales bacterium]
MTAEPTAPADPYAVVIIPAHNESGTIARCLESVLDDPNSDRFDVVVATNGCTDDTALKAESFGHPVRVVDSALPGKTAALDLALAATADVTRIYVDADVVVSSGAMTAIAETIESTGAMAAAPRIQFDTTTSSLWARLYLETWAKADYFTEGHVGTGLYAISAEGHRKIPTFGDLFAEDLLPIQRFGIEQRATASEATFSPLFPRNLRDLVKVQIRQQIGVIEFHRWLEEVGEESTLDSLDRTWITKLLRDPSSWAGVAVYAPLRVLIQIGAAWKHRFGTRTWTRDETSRQAHSS